MLLHFLYLMLVCDISSRPFFILIMNIYVYMVKLAGLPTKIAKLKSFAKFFLYRHSTSLIRRNIGKMSMLKIIFLHKSDSFHACYEIYFLYRVGMLLHINRKISSPLPKYLTRAAISLLT